MVYTCTPDWHMAVLGLLNEIQAKALRSEVSTPVTLQPLLAGTRQVPILYHHKHVVNKL